MMLSNIIKILNMFILTYKFQNGFSISSIMSCRVGEHCSDTFSFSKHPNRYIDGKVSLVLTLIKQDIWSPADDGIVVCGTFQFLRIRSHLDLHLIGLGQVNGTFARMRSTPLMDIFLSTALDKP